MPTYNNSVVARSPYGALMYLRSTSNKDISVSEIFDTPDVELNFEKTTIHTEYTVESNAPRYWCYTHKKLNELPSCNLKNCWGGTGRPPGSTMCLC